MDIEKVIEGLEHCAVEPIVECEGCPYQGDPRCEALLKQEALAELKKKRTTATATNKIEKDKVTLSCTEATL